jgi:transposase
MFIRVKKTPNSSKQFVQIVKSVRQGKKVMQKVVRHIGYAEDDQQLERLKKIAEYIRLKLEDTDNPLLFSPGKIAELSNSNKKEKANRTKAINDSKYTLDIRDIVEEERVITGIHDVYGNLFDEVGMGKTFPKPGRQKMVSAIFKDIVLARIANPQSKNATVSMLEQDFGISIPLHKVYRMMDKLEDEAIKRLKQIVNKHTRGLLGDKIDVIFFDATTLYFESFTDDDFKKSGYSKDLKFSQPQVLLALMVTKSGLPVGYNVYEGNKYEGHTLIPALEELREKYSIDKVIFVADSGMFNKENLIELNAKGFDYIVGARLKNMPDDTKTKILDKSNYKPITSSYSIAEIEYKNDCRLVVSHRENREKKDREDRNKAILKLKKKIKQNKNYKEYMSNYGNKKYLKVIGETRITLDEEKLELASKWDGLHGVITNNKELSGKEILAHYSNLWQVEESFRISKHDLRIRPIYHWTEDRIKAHLAIAFASFSLVRFMEYRIKNQYIKMSPEKIRQTLIKIQTSIIYDTKKKNRYGLPSLIGKDAKRIYNIFNIKRHDTPYLIT